MQAGDTTAFEALVRRHQRTAYFVALRYLRDHEEAADVAQRALLRVWQRASSLREARQFRGWMCRIVVNLALNRLRDRRREPPRPEGSSESSPADSIDEAPDTTETPGAAPERALEQAEVRRRLRAAIAELPERQRRVVELRVYDDLPFAEVAAALGCTENAAKVNFHYAMRSLRRALAPAAPGTEENES